MGILQKVGLKKKDFDNEEYGKPGLSPDEKSSVPSLGQEGVTKPPGLDTYNESNNQFSHQQEGLTKPPQMDPAPRYQTPSSGQQDFMQEGKQEAPSYQKTPNYSMPQQPTPQTEKNDNPKSEFEIVNAKLDTLRALLDNINMRLKSLENKDKKDPWYG